MEAKVPTLVHPHGGNPCSLSIVQKWLDRCFQASTHSRSSGLWLPFAQGISRPEVQTKLFLLIRTQNATLIGRGATAMGPKRHEVRCLFHCHFRLSNYAYQCAMLVCSHFSLPPLVAFDHFMCLSFACHDFFFASPVRAEVSY